MHRGAVIVLFFAYLVGKGPVQSLKCLTCSSKDPYTCLNGKDFRTCEVNQRSCEIEIRYTGNNGLPIITTGCKQEHACKNNNLQNLRAAWDPTQCNDKGKSSVCRCCCTGNKCNYNMNHLRCQPLETTPTPATTLTVATRKNPTLSPPDCGPHPETPVNGKKVCSSGTGPGSFCKFSCNKGYKINGSLTSSCEKQGIIYAWNRSSPKCIKEICEPLPRTPDNGYKLCTGKGVIGSQCRFACETGYKRFGPEKVTCEKAESGLEWSSPPPTCTIDIRCHPLPERPENGDYECTGTGKLGTKCEFTCDADYDLIGQKRTVCVAGVSASKSVTSHLLRVRNPKGAWSNPTPTCKKVRCTLPKTPTNGHRECSGDGKLGTVCDFACHLGYRLKGFSSTTCKRDEQTRGARWTRKVPTCEPLCMTMPEKPEYGSKTCDGKGEIGTLCKFECFPSYQLTGSETTSCKMSRQGPIWTHETPICAPVCKPLPEAPQNGDKKCKGEGRIGTVCTYECDDDFRLKGQSESECEAVENGADWSAQVPTCIPHCMTMPEKPVHGSKKCNGTGEIGTACTFECLPSYQLTGSETTSCEMSNQRPAWNYETPRCTPAVCKPLPDAPQNGRKECDGDGKIGTVCTFSCFPGYELTGNETTSCNMSRQGPIWTHETPICDSPNTCRPPIGELANGTINCNNTIHQVGTACDFQCNEGFTLVPNTENPVVCVENRTWSRKPCCVDCTKVKRDIMIAMDTSESMGKDGWNDMTRFVKNFISKFTYGPNATRFSIFSFGDGLYYKTKFGVAETLDGLKKHVRDMKYRKGGTWTGNALEYANKEFEKESNRKDAPDKLLVLTDGKVKDANKDKMKEQAEILRDNGVEILALAIIPNRKSREFNKTEFYKQMEDMTGDRNKVIKAGSTKEMSEEMDLLFLKACQDETQCKR